MSGELLGRRSRNLFILDRQNPRQSLHHRHLSTEVSIEARKFHPNRPRTHHQKGTGHLCGDHGFFVSPNHFPVRLQIRQDSGSRTRCDENIARDQLGLNPTLGIFHDDTAFATETSPPIDHLDFVLFQQSFHARVQSLGHLPRPLDDFRDIEGNLFGRKAELFHPANQMPHLAGAQQRFGRNASPIQANTTQMFSLDQRDRQPQLPCPDRRRITTGTASDHYDIVGHFSHPTPLFAAASPAPRP